jgi:hypothetical protein
MNQLGPNPKGTEEREFYSTSRGCDALKFFLLTNGVGGDITG